MCNIMTGYGKSKKIWYNIKKLNGKERRRMNKFIKIFYKCCETKFLSVIAVVSLAVTTLNVNTACWYVMGQDELPENSERLRKFGGFK